MEKTRKLTMIAASVVLALLVCTQAWAGAFEDEVSQGLKALELAKGDANLLMMTDAPFVQINGGPALSFLDKAQEITGCTVGKGNLLFYQRPQNHALTFMLFKKGTGEAVIISVDKQDAFSEKLTLDEKTVSDPEFRSKTKHYKAGPDLFTLGLIANMWARGAPYDFLKSAELHNHICPGLTSGYLMAHYILDKYPLKKGQRYTVVACPVWCKEDAFQVVMDCTPGKRSLVVKPLSDEEIKKITLKNPAGMVLIWDAKNKTGQGAVLAFNFDDIRALLPKDASKAALALVALDHLDKPEKFVSIAAEFELTEKLFQDITQAGNNPYVAAGFVGK